MTIKGVAFDMEGTVVNVEPAHHEGWIRAAREIGVNLSGPAEAIERVPNFIGGPDKPIIEQIYALLPGSPQPTNEEIKAFLARKWFHYEELLPAVDLSPRPGFLEFLGKLRSLGIHTIIGTAVELKQGLALLKHSGLAKLFLLHHIVLLTDVANPKPAPDCFLETAKRMGIDPKEQLVFEDSPRGVKSGVTAGSPVIGVAVYNLDTAKNALRAAGAHKVFTDWRDIDINVLKDFD
ncbi:MAG: HAD family phosphatase [Parcubacteria group bacterium]|nr:HAD family phosphatase [Parcubacteria group bacterium]